MNSIGGKCAEFYIGLNSSKNMLLLFNNYSVLKKYFLLLIRFLMSKTFVFFLFIYPLLFKKLKPNT